MASELEASAPLSAAVDLSNKMANNATSEGETKDVHVEGENEVEQQEENSDCLEDTSKAFMGKKRMRTSSVWTDFVR